MNNASQTFDTMTGMFTRNLGQAVPGRHTQKIYDRLSRSQAAVLSQLRTGKNRLNHYLVRVEIIQSEGCDCEREPETVGHFLLRCARWAEENLLIPNLFDLSQKSAQFCSISVLERVIFSLPGSECHTQLLDMYRSSDRPQNRELNDPGGNG